MISAEWWGRKWSVLADLNSYRQNVHLVWALLCHVKCYCVLSIHRDAHLLDELVVSGLSGVPSGEWDSSLGPEGNRLARDRYTHQKRS